MRVERRIGPCGSTTSTPTAHLLYVRRCAFITCVCARARMCGWVRMCVCVWVCERVCVAAAAAHSIAQWRRMHKSLPARMCERKSILIRVCCSHCFCGSFCSRCYCCCCCCYCCCCCCRRCCCCCCVELRLLVALNIPCGERLLLPCCHCNCLSVVENVAGTTRSVALSCDGLRVCRIVAYSTLQLAHCCRFPLLCLRQRSTKEIEIPHRVKHLSVVAE